MLKRVLGFWHELFLIDSSVSWNLTWIISEEKQKIVECLWGYMATLRVYFRTLGGNGLAVLRILTSIMLICTSTQVSLLRETENFAKENSRYNQMLCPIGKNVEYCKILVIYWGCQMVWGSSVAFWGFFSNLRDSNLSFQILWCGEDVFWKKLLSENAQITYFSIQRYQKYCPC